MARDNEKWKARKREWSARNIHKITSNKKRYVKRNVEFINSIKLAPCADCGIKYPPFVMDFDHIKGDKYDEISHMVRKPVSLDRLKEEIKKCDIVCSNCHRYRTHNMP